MANKPDKTRTPRVTYSRGANARPLAPAAAPSYAGADGVKIGYTEESQQTIVASATRDGRRIIASVMRSQDRYTDAERLLDWAFAQPSSCP